VLLVAPAGGDELQGVKRGIMELADIIVVNKCDGSLEAQARVTLSEYASALRLVRPASSSWTPIALAASAITGYGIDEVWTTLEALRAARTESGDFEDRRVEQQKTWLWTDVTERIVDDLRADDRVVGIVDEVQRGNRTIASGVEAILALRPSASP
jgi:LAO/AO transport system kinase